MHAEYTPEEVRTLLAEDLPLEYASATDADAYSRPQTYWRASRSSFASSTPPPAATNC